MIDGFYLYIFGDCVGYIESDIIPKEHDVITYEDKDYNVVTVKHIIEKDKYFKQHIKYINIYAII